MAVREQSTHVNSLPAGTKLTALHFTDVRLQFLLVDLGAGKTTFARGFISCKLGWDQGKGHALKVTSPTYLLSNTYCYHDEITEKMEE